MNDAAPQSEVEALREQLAAAEAAVVALHASSSFEDSTAKGAVHRRLQSDSDHVALFGKCYDPTLTELRALPASTAARRAARPSLGVAGGSTTTR